MNFICFCIISNLSILNKRYPALKRSSEYINSKFKSRVTYENKVKHELFIQMSDKFTFYVRPLASTSLKIM